MQIYGPSTSRPFYASRSDDVKCLAAKPFPSSFGGFAISILMLFLAEPAMANTLARCLTTTSFLLRVFIYIPLASTDPVLFMLMRWKFYRPLCSSITKSLFSQCASLFSHTNSETIRCSAAPMLYRRSKRSGFVKVASLSYRKHYVNYGSHRR